MKNKVILISLLAVFMACSIAYAAGTPAGTAISNYATGEYHDANGNILPNVTSNTVTTIVTQVAGVDISPESNSANIVLYGTVSSTLSLTNTGNGTDSFDLSKLSVETGNGVNTVEIYHDANANGVVDAGEEIVTEITDLAADATFDLVVKISNISGDDGAYCTTTITGTSQYDSGVSDASNIVSTISASVLDITMTADNLSPKPGDIVTFMVAGENNGSAMAKHVVITCPIPSNTTYVPGSMSITDVMVRTDVADGDSSDYNVTTAGAVTLTWGNAPSGVSGYIKYQVQVNEGVPLGTIINPEVSVQFNNVLDLAQQPVSGNVTGAKLTISQLYAIEIGANKSTIGDPGDIVYYTTTATNTGNGPDIFSLSYTNAMTTWEFYFDHNADGLINNGDVLITDSNLDGKLDIGTLMQNEVVYLIGKAQIPAGASDAYSSNMIVTATSVGDASVSDAGTLTITVTAPVLSMIKTVSPTGNHPPGTTLTYTCTLTNAGTGVATSVVISDDVPTNTTYETGSMKIGASSKTDVSDGDGATQSGNAVIFEIPQLGPGGSTTVSFQSTIN